MANHASHAALPYPVKNARFTVLVPYLDDDGDPTAPTTPDTEVSKDNGAAADCAEEVSATSGMDGMGMLTLTGAETNCSCLALNAKVASGPKATLQTLFPRVLPVLFSGTAGAGAAGSITLASDVPAAANLLIGCIVRTTGGTGGGGTGGANNQARVITGYSTGRVASVSPDWETTPDNTTTYDILVTEAALVRYADVRLLFGGLTAAEKLAAHAPGVLKGIVAASGSSTTLIALHATTGIDGAAPSSTNDFYNGRVVVFTSGALAGQATSISDYDGSSKVLTVVALTGTPSSGDTFVVV